MPHNILIAGVAPDWLATAATKGFDVPMPSADIAASLQKSEEAEKTFSDTYFAKFLLHPDDAADFDDFVALVKSRKWDAITYGGGLRLIPQLTDFFTKLVHLANSEQPGAKLLFPLLPEGVVPEVRAHVPEAK